MTIRQSLDIPTHPVILAAGLVCLAMSMDVERAAAEPPPDEEVTRKVELSGGESEEAAEMQTFRRLYLSYAERLGAYRRGDVERVARVWYGWVVDRMTAEGEPGGVWLQPEVRALRGRAIAKLENFVELHPEHPGYTPDAMLRLAELYFQHEAASYVEAVREYERGIEAYRAGKRPERPARPTTDFGGTVRTAEALVARWPEYRRVDGAYYLLGLALLHDRRPRKARDTFAELVVRRPTSPFVTEAWVRIGDYHFDRAHDLPTMSLAESAYRRAIRDASSPWHDWVRYRLAWTLYRMDEFDRAIERFKRLIAYFDRRSEQLDDDFATLRDEAINHIANMLAEPDWNLDLAIDEAHGLPRIKKYLDGVPFRREIIVAMYDDLYEMAFNEKLVEVIRYALEDQPMHPGNPTLHRKLIKVLTRMLDHREEAAEARRRLRDLYGPDSEWDAHQKKHGRDEAIDRAQKLIRELEPAKQPK